MTDTQNLETTLEELRTAEEELRAQNEELRTAQAALQDERRRYAELFDVAPDAVFVTDADGRIVEANSAALQMLEVDKHGFDEMDRRLLLAIIEKYQGGPVGLNTLAAALAEEADAIEDIYEPFLIQIGFLDRTPRGRVATQLAYDHFGIRAPRRQPPLF